MHICWCDLQDVRRQYGERRYSKRRISRERSYSTNAGQTAVLKICLSCRLLSIRGWQLTWPVFNYISLNGDFLIKNHNFCNCSVHRVEWEKTMLYISHLLHWHTTSIQSFKQFIWELLTYDTMSRLSYSTNVNICTRKLLIVDQWTSHANTLLLQIDSHIQYLY